MRTGELKQPAIEINLLKQCPLSILEEMVFWCQSRSGVYIVLGAQATVVPLPLSNGLCIGRFALPDHQVVVQTLVDERPISRVEAILVCLHPRSSGYI